MPFDIRKKPNSNKWETYNTDTGEVKGEHDTKEEAEKHRSALYANVPDAQKSLTTVPKNWPQHNN